MEIPRHWRLKAQRYRLVGSTCPTCGQLSFPPRPVCLDCAAQPVRIAGCELVVTPLLDRVPDIVSTERTIR